MFEGCIEMGLFTQLHHLFEVLVVDVGVHTKQPLQDRLGNGQEIFRKRDSCTWKTHNMAMLVNYVQKQPCILHSLHDSISVLAWLSVQDIHQPVLFQSLSTQRNAISGFNLYTIINSKSMKLYSQLFSKTQEITGFKNQFDRSSKKLISKTTFKLLHLKYLNFSSKWQIISGIISETIRTLLILWQMIITGNCQNKRQW